MSDFELKAGMYVELKNGLSGILVPWRGKLEIVGKSYGEATKFSALAEARLYEDNEDGYSIVKVYSDDFSNAHYAGGCFSADGRNLLYDYKQKPKELTVAEIEELLGYKVKIVEG